MPREPKIPKGLYFFHKEAPVSYKRQRVLFVVAMGVLCLSIAWPVYPIFSAIYPMVFGFPFSFMWIIVCLMFSLIALITLYRLDQPFDNNREA